jgi:hypothetical protein
VVACILFCTTDVKTAIFDLDKPKLSKLYSALSCAHHLISPSSDPYKTPHLPALTAQGFETWATLFILASPDHEFRRLAAAVREWPICNADDRRDRLPKELSRRLFPPAGALVPERRRRLCEVLQKFGIVAAAEVRQPPAPAAQQHHQTTHGAGRRPADVDSVSSLSETESEPGDDTPRRHTHHHQHRSHHHHSRSQPAPPPARQQPAAQQQPATQPPIERERKPYVAKEGSGKIHFDAAAPGPPHMARTVSSGSHSGSTPLTPNSASLGAGGFSAPSAFEHPGWGALHHHHLQQQQQQQQQARQAQQQAEYQAQQQAEYQAQQQAQYGLGGGYAPAGAFVAMDGMFYQAPGESMLDVERELRRARIEEDMRTRGFAGGSGYGNDGNPPLGTGERRY